MNTVRVLLFARIRDIAGVDSVKMNLATGATVAHLRHALTATFPAMAEMLPRCAIAIRGEYADDNESIPPNAELAVIPPVSGGS